ncbi:hypothetical protein AG1IA_03297 [Rhizoctonia solani AG-1 IA]|uniref:Uncharacterized protein n=1 Tax=Thanatephorus cucumeris (strain AG1-IA) TaxID=983506 RepID=L8X0X0_THACA|nr:hypothetical protein AG1IA_03297 [Rhizoctonia solani AG-1 IA]
MTGASTNDLPNIYQIGLKRTVIYTSSIDVLVETEIRLYQVRPQVLPHHNMPKIIESRSLSAPPTSSPKTPNRLVHPLSTQLFPPPPAPQHQTLSLKHSWRIPRQVTDIGPVPVRISTSSNKRIIVPATPTTTTDSSLGLASPEQEQEQTLPPTEDNANDATSS